MNKTLYVTDLDGTLMRDDKTISPETIRILRKSFNLPMKKCPLSDNVSRGNPYRDLLHPISTGMKKFYIEKAPPIRGSIIIWPIMPMIKGSGQSLRKRNCIRELRAILPL